MMYECSEEGCTAKPVTPWRSLCHWHALISGATKEEVAAFFEKIEAATNEDAKELDRARHERSLTRPDEKCGWDYHDRPPILFTCERCGVFTCECYDSPDSPARECGECWDREHHPEEYE